MEGAELLRCRVLVAKPGLDGHDRGARSIAVALRDAGFEVVYTGLRQSPTQIAVAAVQENVDIVGLSILTGGHAGLTDKVIKALRDLDADDIAVVVGGVIPDEDIPTLIDLGVTAVFPSSTPMDHVMAGMRDVARRRGSQVVL